MKKILLTAVLFTAMTVSAQQKGTIEFGFNVGFNYSAARVESFSTDTGTGINVGASADYYFSDRWSIKAKLIYDQKGWDKGIYTEESFDPAVSGSYITNFNVNYITVPVMANWHFGSKRNWYLNFGPYAGFLVNAEETEGGNDVKYAFNTTDFGLALGIGVKIPVNDKIKVSIEYEEETGISDIFKENEDSAVRMARGSLNLGIYFLLK